MYVFTVYKYLWGEYKNVDCSKGPCPQRAYCSSQCHNEWATGEKATHNSTQQFDLLANESQRPPEFRQWEISVERLLSLTRLGIAKNPTVITCLKRWLPWTLSFLACTSTPCWKGGVCFFSSSSLSWPMTASTSGTWWKLSCGVSSGPAFKIGNFYLLSSTPADTLWGKSKWRITEAPGPPSLLSTSLAAMCTVLAIDPGIQGSASADMTWSR